MSRHDDEPIAPELTAMEQALQGLAPRSPDRRLRDQILFQAGAASAHSRRSRASGRLWMATAAALGMVAMGEGVLLSQRPVVERVIVQAPPVPAPSPGIKPSLVHVEQETKPTPEPAPKSVAPAWATSIPSTPSALLSWQVARYGLDGLPPSPSAMGWGTATGDGKGAASAWEMREALFRELGIEGGPTS